MQCGYFICMFSNRLQGIKNANTIKMAINSPSAKATGVQGHCPWKRSPGRGPVLSSARLSVYNSSATLLGILVASDPLILSLIHFSIIFHDY